MRTIQNILLGLTALIVGISALQAGNNDTHKNRKSGNKEWVSIGPVDVPGRVLAIHVDNNDNMRVYAGTAGGGLWISTNGGASWNRCINLIGSAAVSAIAQASNGRLFIGTGEGLNPSYALSGVKDNLDSYGITGDGVYYSDDISKCDGAIAYKEATFTKIESTASWREINTMAYDTKNNKLYVGTNEGLKVSTDNGTSFSPAMSGPGSTSKVFDVKVGSDGSVICAIFPANGDVRISKDNGATFTSVCGTSATKLPNNAGRISVGIAPSDPNIMYAFVADNVNSDYASFMGVYVSLDKGESWRKIFKSGGYNDPMLGNGAYMNVLAVSPTNPNKVFVGSFLLYQVIKTDSTQLDENGEILYQPLPSGKYWVGDPNVPSSYLGTADGIHSIFYSGKTIYLGTSSGIFYSSNDGSLFEERNRALRNTQIFSMSAGINGRIIAGTRENGSVYIRNPKDWDAHSEQLSYGNGGKSVFSILKPDALYYFAGYNGYRRASFESDAQDPAQWYTTNGEENCIMEKGATSPRWRNSDNEKRSTIIQLASPFLFWESAEDYKSKDSVTFIADRDYEKGEAICAKSARNKYPIWTTNTTGDKLYQDTTGVWIIDTITKDTTGRTVRNNIMRVHDIVTSRLFMGGGGFIGKSVPVGAPVFMSLTALNYDIIQRWNCVFHTDDIGDMVAGMAVSRDGDHLFILTKNVGSSAIHRVSGFDEYRALEEVDKFNYDYANPGSGYGGSVGGLFTPNSLRKLTDEVLLTTGDDILSIALDPQNDDNLMYTTSDYDRVMLITNATTATYPALVDNKEGTGLPDNIPVYTGLIVKKKDNDNKSNVAYIGTELGVYETNDFDTPNPTWELYKNGIDINVPIFQLYQQTKDVNPVVSVVYDGTKEPDTVYNFPAVSNLGVIYAATHGAGIFVDTSQFIPRITSVKQYFNATKSTDNKLKVYPNPASSSIFVDYALQSNEFILLKIVDVMGRVVYTENLGTKESGSYSQEIDCSNLPNGFYLINMTIGKQTRVAKFVVFK